MNTKKIKKNLYITITTIVFVVFISLVSVTAQQVFIANLSGAQEVPAVTTGGKGVCKVVLNTAETQMTVNCSYSGLSSSANAGHIHGNGVIGTTAPILFNFGTVSGTSGTLSPSPFTVTAQQVADMRANKYYANIHTANNPGGEIRGQLHVANNNYNDVDGDGRQDVTVFRPSTGFFYSKSSLNGSLLFKQFGTGTDITGVNLDFDGDGISDYAFARINPNTGQATFNFLLSQTNTVRAVQLGNVALGDSIASGDYDGDGAMDLGIYNSGLWTYIESSTGTTKTFRWGQAGDVPIPTGDFDRDGKTDFAVARPTNGVYVWYIRLSSTGQLKAFTYGLTSDSILTPFDFDADGAGDPAVYRDVNNVRTFYVLRSSDNQLMSTQWGVGSDLARIGDFDGDGKTDFVAIRNQSGALYWYINQSTGGFRVDQWGAAGDQ